MRLLALEASAASAAASTLLRSFSARVGSTAVPMLALAAPFACNACTLGRWPRDYRFCVLLGLRDWHLEDIQHSFFFAARLFLRQVISSSESMRGSDHLSQNHVGFPVNGRLYDLVEGNQHLLYQLT
jgi:hypothetical protein